MAIKPIEVEYILKDRLTSGVKEAGKSLKGLGKTAKHSGDELRRGIAQAQGTVRSLTDEVKHLERQMSKLPSGGRRAALEADLATAKRALAQERSSLEALAQSYQETSHKSQSLVQEQRQLIQSMAQLKRAGKDNSQEYQLMARRAAEITDALADVRAETNALAHDNAGFVGVTTALQGVAGGFTALTGTMSLFVGESEELQRIQTRLQAVMAITMGIQQALDAFNRSSAFSTVLLAKAKGLLTAANVRLAAALGVSTVAAQALMATLTLGLSAAITALIVWYNKYTEAQEAAERASKERLEVEREARVQAFKSRAELQETIRTIKTFTGSKEEEQRKVKELNQTYGATFGYYDSLAKWYDVLSQKSHHYIQILFLQAKAQSLINKAAEADGKVGEIEATPLEQYASWTDKFDLKRAGYNIPLLKKREALKVAQGERDAYLQEAKKLQEEITALAKGNKIGGLGGELVHQDLEAAKRDAEAARQKARERIKAIEEGTKALAQAQEQGRAYLNQVNLSMMKEGRDKERRQAEISWQEERERIEREGERRLALIKKLREHGAKISPEEELGVRAQTEAEQAANTALKAARLKAIDDDEAEDWRTYLSRFRDFATKRAAIEEAYTADLAKLRSQQNEGNAEEIKRAIVEATRQRAEAMRAVDAEEVEASQGVTNALVRLYEDASEKSIEQIKRIIQESQALIDYLKRTPLEQLEDFSGVSSAQLRLIKDDPQAIKRLEEAIKRLKGEVAGRNPLERFFQSWHEGVEDIKSGEIAKGIIKIGSAVTSIMPEIKALGKALGDLIGESSLGEDIGMLADGLSALGATAAGVGQLIAGDILSGTKNIVAGIGTLISMAGKAEQAHREALERVHQAQLAFEREYQIALLRTRLLAEQATTPFGSDKVYKAAEALRVYADAQRQLKEQLRGRDPRERLDYMLYGSLGIFKEQIKAYESGIGALAQIGIVTGHRKTGLFGWGKGEDVYSSLLEVYPKLIKANGELDEIMLEEIIKTQRMSDEDKKRLEGLLQTTQVAKEAQQAFDDYLSETFGSLGSSMTDALITSIQQGGDALELFAKDAARVMQGLLKQSIFASFFKQHFEDYRKKLKQAYTESQGMNIVDTVRGITQELITGLKETVPTAKAAAEAGLQALKEAGLSTLDPHSQQARSGAFTTMTQEQGTKLEGLFTSVQMHLASMDDQMHGYTADLSGILDSLSLIAQHTAPIATILQEIQLIRRDGVSIK